MTRYFTGSLNVAQYVNDQLQYLDEGSPLTMTITREKSGGLCVTIVTGSLSDDTGLLTAKFFSDTQVNT